MPSVASATRPSRSFSPCASTRFEGEPRRRLPAELPAVVRVDVEGLAGRRPGSRCAASTRCPRRRRGGSRGRAGGAGSSRIVRTGEAMRSPRLSARNERRCWTAPAVSAPSMRPTQHGGRLGVDEHRGARGWTPWPRRAGRARGGAPPRRRSSARGSPSRCVPADEPVILGALRLALADRHGRAVADAPCDDSVPRKPFELARADSACTSWTWEVDGDHALVRRARRPRLGAPVRCARDA